LPAEYVLLALAASKATYCCSPAAASTRLEKNKKDARMVLLPLPGLFHRFG